MGTTKNNVPHQKSFLLLELIVVIASHAGAY